MQPRILIVTPEITYLPQGMGNLSQRMSAKAGGLADVSASLVRALYEQGADVHIALPNYRKMFHLDVQNVFELEFEKVSRTLPEQHIHLAEDRIFYHRSSVYSSAAENHLISLAFQREVINHTIPQVRPDIIHCNDWMTGLIPAVARRHGIASLFTLHNIHTEYLALSQIEDRGIDAIDFWRTLYFERLPITYEQSHDHNRVDLLTSGIFAADHVNTVSPTFLHEIISGFHSFVPWQIQRELTNKYHASCASGVLNAPDSSYHPEDDPSLKMRYSAKSHAKGKKANKQYLQETLELHINPSVPLLFWPSRLDSMQKGCQLLANILYDTIADYHELGLQIAIIANGNFQKHFHEIVSYHQLQNRVAVLDFDEKLSRIAYAGADFILMPSSFEPCGLPQMISPIYGTLPIAYDTGGIHDTVTHLDGEKDTGNGFLFTHHDPPGLRWAIDQAMAFWQLPTKQRNATISRIMTESTTQFSHENTASAYIELYEKILQRSLADS